MRGAMAWCLRAAAHVKAYFQHLLDNGKLPLQALCAVMRKLLHAIHGMLKHDKPRSLPGRR